MFIIKKLVISLFTVILTAAFCIDGVHADFTQEISARSAIVIDADSGQILYEKNSGESMLIASTTKILTALVVIDRCPLDDIVTVGEESASVEGSSMYLTAGEQLTVKELLYGLLMESGNDAAAALAIHAAGSIEAFADMMNAKAQELGCDGSHFENPHGLDAQEHYSCAKDLAIITSEAMKNKVFSDIVSTKTASVGGRSFSNHNKLLWQYDGAVGVKTGYTMAAGRILVSAVSKEGMELICVTISAPDDWDDHTKLYDWALSEYRCITVSDDSLGEITVPVISGVRDSVTVKVLSVRKLLIKADEEPEFKYVLPKFIYAPVKTGAYAGQVKVFCGGQELCALELWYCDGSELDKNAELTRWQRIKRSWLFLKG